MSIINMQTMRYLNLLDRASRVRTRKCFIYNNTIIFAVPRVLISKAIGPDASNIRRLQEQIRKRIRIIGEARDVSDAPHFVSDIIYPTKFKSLDISENAVVITAGNTQAKAMLIGRERRRFIELKQIIEDVFHLDLKII